eukprot:5153289-Pleurochrysis_carterae.AAC.1
MEGNVLGRGQDRARVVNVRSMRFGGHATHAEGRTAGTCRELHCAAASGVGEKRFADCRISRVGVRGEGSAAGELVA